MVVRVRGHELLNIAVGIARGFRADEGERVPVTDTTPFQVMSASKPLVAFAVAVLEDRGLIDVDRPVAYYVPEFGRAGKGEITLLEVLTHRSGVIVPHLWESPAMWPDWDRVQVEIWDARPRYRRGTLAYHPFEFGWILGEVVHRVAGQPLDRFLGDLLPDSLQPLRLRRDPSDTTLVAHSYWLGRERLRLGSQDVAETFEQKNNSRLTHTSLVPGASLTTPASTLAQFYEILLGGGTTADGNRLVSATTLERYITPNVTGFDRTLRSILVVGRGFLLGWLGPHPYGWWNSRSCFGHGGGFCAVVFGDRATGAAVAIITNGNRSLWDVQRRFAPLSSAIRREVGVAVGRSGSGSAA
jgi:CubicO group peptidase (beta-lactamase class C family)